MEDDELKKKSTQHTTLKIYRKQKLKLPYKVKINNFFFMKFINIIKTAHKCRLKYVFFFFC
jgi:hypothetical protein